MQDKTPSASPSVPSAPTELEAAAKSLKQSFAEAQAKAAKLHASDDFWAFEAFKGAEMAVIKANYNTSEVIKSAEGKVKAARAIVLEAKKTERPIDFQKESVLKEVGKLLGQRILNRNADVKLEGVGITGAQSAREAYRTAVAAFLAKNKVAAIATAQASQKQ